MTTLAFVIAVAALAVNGWTAMTLRRVRRMQKAEDAARALLSDLRRELAAGTDAARTGAAEPQLANPTKAKGGL